MSMAEHMQRENHMVSQGGERLGPDSGFYDNPHTRIAF